MKMLMLGNSDGMSSLWRFVTINQGIKNVLGVVRVEYFGR